MAWEEESEEEQMEKFFALIKSTKDALDQLSKQKEEQKAKNVWKPSFEAEDFMHDQELMKINFKNTPDRSGKETEQDPPHKESAEPTTEPHSHNQNGNNNKSTRDLDLTLSL
ncbi:protein NIM1-INTERACTING 3-like [Vigna radiata var. radiata]|uniref:Protein NIM1-INTERACTING 3-like n=1 Tax=Vigna radiata var. radiata TaxID=3916 RepID=A0A3Q0F9N4_VIGRR|nr:protein NIM1-INTERACTING 3-like [Vigna radiata var. radiata]